MAEDRFARAIARFDALNAQDPVSESDGGVDTPKALLYGQRMSACLEHFAPEASELLRLAVRAQHLCRFRIPRDDYPRNRPGYLKWRTDLAKLHAELGAEVLEAEGYDEADIAELQKLLRKKGRETSADVQLLEDTACLVFLDHYLHDFAKQHDEEKLVSIVQKTWAKMSEAAHGKALTLAYAAEDLALVNKALG